LVGEEVIHFPVYHINPVGQRSGILDGTDTREVPKFKIGPEVYIGKLLQDPSVKIDRGSADNKVVRLDFESVSFYIEFQSYLSVVFLNVLEQQLQGKLIFRAQGIVAELGAVGRYEKLADLYGVKLRIRVKR
jgi:hypothetical protein